MKPTTVIVVVIVVVAILILVKLKKLDKESRSKLESGMPKNSDLPGRSEISNDSETQKETELPSDRQKIFEKARLIQERYWSPNPAEKKRLLLKGIDGLAWQKSLRLLHLACLEMLSEGHCKEQFLDEEIALEGSADAASGENRDLIVKLVTHLLSEKSPYKPRHVAVWQGKVGESEKRKEDIYGVLGNASLTHLGCIEVIRLDDEQQPSELAFVSFDEIRGAVFGDPAMLRFGRLFFDDGRPDEVVLVPLLYGISWHSPHDYDHDGRLTRFICGVNIDDDKPNFAIGVGQQDYLMEDNGQSVFGLESIGEMMVTLFVNDPKFNIKCLARGLDPDEVRRSLN